MLQPTYTKEDYRIPTTSNLEAYELQQQKSRPVTFLSVKNAIILPGLQKFGTRSLEKRSSMLSLNVWLDIWLDRSEFGISNMKAHFGPLLGFPISLWPQCGHLVITFNRIMWHVSKLIFNWFLEYLMSLRCPPQSPNLNLK